MRCSVRRYIAGAFAYIYIYAGRGNQISMRWLSLSLSFLLPPRARARALSPRPLIFHLVTPINLTARQRLHLSSFLSFALSPLYCFLSLAHDSSILLLILIPLLLRFSLPALCIYSFRTRLRYAYAVAMLYIHCASVSRSQIAREKLSSSAI